MASAIEYTAIGTLTLIAAGAGAIEIHNYFSTPSEGTQSPPIARCSFENASGKQSHFTLHGIGTKNPTIIVNGKKADCAYFGM